MSLKSRTVIDCTQAPDILAGWPVADNIRLSATAEALLAELNPDWVLDAADLDNEAYVINADAGTITVNTKGLSKAAIVKSDYLRTAFVLQSFAALRAAWQAEREADARARHRPDIWLFLSRLAAADIATLTARMAFEARTGGDETVWRHALGDADGDMAMAYLQESERAIYASTDTWALTATFTQWFTKPARVAMADRNALADMDDSLEALTMSGAGRVDAGAVRCLTLDPLTGQSYLGRTVADFAGNPVWRTITDPVNEAHFLQIMDEIGTIRQGAVAMRDKKLAARLFPDMMVSV